MRISDWSSDVCSSDLETRTYAKYGFRASDRELTNRCAGRSGARLGIWHTWVGTVQKGDQQGSPGLVGHVVMCYRLTHVDRGRSEERSVGKERDRTSRARWSRYRVKKINKTE